MAGGGDFLIGGGDGRDSNSGSDDDSVKSIGFESLAFFFGRPVPDFWPLEKLAPTMVSDIRVL